MWFRKTSPRRQAIREDVAESESLSPGQRHYYLHITLIAAVFFVVACAVQFWPGPIAPYRAGETAPVTIRSPVTFTIVDNDKTETNRDAARLQSPPVLAPEPFGADHVIGKLVGFKQDLSNSRTLADVPQSIRTLLPGLTEPSLRQLQTVDPNGYATAVRTFVNGDFRKVPFITPDDFQALPKKSLNRVAIMTLPGSVGENIIEQPLRDVIVLGNVTPDQRARLKALAAKDLGQGMGDTVAAYLAAALDKPTYSYSPKLTTELADLRAAQVIPPGEPIAKNQEIIEAGKPVTVESLRKLTEAQKTLQQESLEPTAQKPWAAWSLWLVRLGRMLTVLMLTIVGVLYVVRMNPPASVAEGKRANAGATTIRQGWAVCGLLLAALIVARAVVGHWPQSAYLSAIAPTLFAAIILVIAYNQRFALGMAALHGLLVVVTLGLGIEFFLAMLAGVAVYCFGLAEIRTRGKLIEMGFLAGVAIFLAVWALGLTRLIGSVWNPWIVPTDLSVIVEQSLWAAAGGLLVAMVMTAALPAVERIFKITTAMTLLELCDANKPLLRRLQQEAPGTFNHSLTVGIMAEAAGNAIGANGLLCRVGAYYHDVGKLSKPQYFIENQTGGAPNRHDKLSPAMSLLIIVGHVKDGIELAREYSLPSVVHQFIAQHHGTTLVEYFFHAAKKRREQEGDKIGDVAEVSETEFRYPGPRPQTREAAIVMICDTCESVVRSIEEPTPGRIEAAVHTMIMKRLMDGQFSECDLTLRSLSTIEQALVRTLAGIHHGRVAYPAAASDQPLPLSQPA